MTNQENQHIEEPEDANSSSSSHPITKGIGTAGGGIAGAAIGNTMGGKIGAAVGGIAGAIAGGMAGDAVATLTEEILEEISPSLSLTLGADAKEVELPAHYSWAELQALSKPQLERL